MPPEKHKIIMINCTDDEIKNQLFELFNKVQSLFPSIPIQFALIPQKIKYNTIEQLQKLQKDFHVSCVAEIQNTKQLSQILNTNIDGIMLGTSLLNNPIQLQNALQIIALHKKHTPTYIFISNITMWFDNIATFEQILQEKKQEMDNRHLVLLYTDNNSENNSDLQQKLFDRKHHYRILYNTSCVCGNMTCLYQLCKYIVSDKYNGVVFNFTETENQSCKKMTSTINDLTAFIDSLQSEYTSNCDELTFFRYLLNKTDDDFFNYLQQRMEIVQWIARYKKIKGIDIVQPQQYEIVKERFIEKAKKQHLSSKQICDIFETIHDMSVMEQNKWFHKN